MGFYTFDISGTPLSTTGRYDNQDKAMKRAQDLADNHGTSVRVYQGSRFVGTRIARPESGGR